nr:protein b166 [Mastomys natalensis cytomegalovirus 3]WEG69982.1 protein b166 [Mastomys natalensis cytomegalovirus 3]WEG70122.1 protein b166 [Mastomys natalensis cytomegalovirus 3]WEG70262.1 protein b166 [Mastomys natalensis cytomegalovirus 3]WEG70402.1 protein b166 [Mastomys natalensis cytomegalovirus 3]
MNSFSLMLLLSTITLCVACRRMSIVMDRVVHEDNANKKELSGHIICDDIVIVHFSSLSHSKTVLGILFVQMGMLYHHFLKDFQNEHKNATSVGIAYLCEYHNKLHCMVSYMVNGQSETNGPLRIPSIEDNPSLQCLDDCPFDFHHLLHSIFNVVRDYIILYTDTRNRKTCEYSEIPSYRS